MASDNHSFLSNGTKQMLYPGIAGSMAVLFSHPIDLTKTRLQLDNEMAKRGAPRHYSGIVNCISHNWKKDGIRGLQRGLSFGIAREFAYSSARIGSFDPALKIMKNINGTSNSPPTYFERYVVGQTMGNYFKFQYV